VEHNLRCRQFLLRTPLRSTVSVPLSSNDAQQLLCAPAATRHAAYHLLQLNHWLLRVTMHTPPLKKKISIKTIIFREITVK
jgi:hypothetical protein